MDGVRGEVVQVGVMASEAAGELALLAAAPEPNQAVGGEGEGVVGSAGDLGDVAEAGDQSWRRLFFDEFAVVSKPNRSFPLKFCFIF